MPKKKLSSQHAKFCLLMAGGNIHQTAAYMETHPDCTYESARRASSKLMTKDDIKAEIDRLQKLTETDKVMSRTYKRGRLTAIANGEVEDGKVSDMTKAIDIDNRMAGDYEPDVVEYNIKVTWGKSA